MLVVAGPPGSGKSIAFPVRAHGVDAFNIDDRCAELNGGSYVGIAPETRRAAVAEAVQFIDLHIAMGRSFAVETTLRTRAAIEQGRRARDRGFDTRALFIATESAEINVARVDRRARMGGHGAPPDEIRAAYRASITLLPALLEAFERVWLYDNSAEHHPGRPSLVRVADVEDGAVTWVRAGPVPSWADGALAGRRARR
jgi:predicted ABC-type ATPase